jgi:hypothetical protein
MKFLADEWPKALESILLGAIVVLSLLPSLGWTWHSVLPEHSHVFLSLAQFVIDKGVSDENPTRFQFPSFSDPDVCTHCTGTAMRSGVIHVPSFDGLQIFVTAVASGGLLVIVRPPDFVNRVFFPRITDLSLVLPLLDPPPKMA